MTGFILWLLATASWVEPATQDDVAPITPTELEDRVAKPLEGPETEWDRTQRLLARCRASDFDAAGIEDVTEVLVDTSVNLRWAGQLPSARAWMEYAVTLGGPVQRWVRLELAICERQGGSTNAALLAMEGLERETRDAQALSENDQRLRAFVLDELAESYLRIGVTDEAGRWLRELQAQRDTLDEYARGNLALRQANLLLATDRFSAMASHVAQAFQPEGICASDPAGVLAGQLWLRDARAHRSLAERAASDDDRNRAIEAAESSLERALACHLDPFEQRVAQLLEADILLLSGDDSSAYELLDAPPSLDPASCPPSLALWDALLRERADALDEPASDLQAAFDASVVEWLEFPVRPGGVGFLHYDHARQLIVRLADHLGRDVETSSQLAELVMRARTAGSLARALAAEPPTVDSVRTELLQPRHGLLSFVFGTRETLVIALDHQRVERTMLDVGTFDLIALSRRDFATRVDTLQALLVTDAVSHWLTTWERVTVVGAAQPADVPIECVHVAGTPLGVGWAVDHLSSEAAALALARRTPLPGNAPRTLLVTEPASSRAEPPPLVLDATHRRLVRDAVAWNQEWVGGNATRSALNEFGDYDFAHLFLHGVHDASEERSAALLLAPCPLDADGVVSCADLEGVNAPRVVALSVCGTRRGPERAGDTDAGHWAGLLLRHGAQVVVHSEADLSVHATAERTHDAWSALHAGGLSVAEVMRDARRNAYERGAWRGEDGVLQVVGLGQVAPWTALDGSRRLAATGSPDTSTDGVKPAWPPHRRWLLIGAGVLAIAAVWTARKRRGT